MLLELLLGLAAFCRTRSDSPMPYCDGVGMSDGCSGHFVKSTFDRMRSAIRPPTWQAVLVSVRKNYCQFASWPARPAPFQINHPQEFWILAFIYVPALSLRGVFAFVSSHKLL